MKPSFEPTLIPTFHPTEQPILPPLNFTTFNITSLADKLFAAARVPSITPSSSILKFTNSVNGNLNSLVNAHYNWRRFVQSTLTSPFPQSYVWITLNSSGLVVGSNHVFSAHESCFNNSATSNLVRAIKLDVSIRVSCGPKTWVYSNGTLSVVAASTALNATCPDPIYETTTFLIPEIACMSSVNFKLAAVLMIAQIPIVRATVPVVQSLTVVPGSERATVTVRVSGATTGLVYCAALRRGFTPASVNAIKSKKFSGIISTISSNSSATVTVAGLVPVTDYDVYCYAEDLSGNGGLLSSTLGSMVGLTTLCCKLVTFSSAPPAVYSDPSVYFNTSAASGASSSSYTYSYQLSASPSKQIVVNIVLKYINGTVSSTVYALPPSLSYSNASFSVALIGNFILSGQPGAYLVTLDVQGDSANEYQTASVQVRLMDKSSLPSVPRFLSVVFSHTGATAVASFDSATDHGKVASQIWPCSELFLFQGDNSTLCSWSTASTVLLTFQYSNGGEQLVPGQTVTLRRGLVRAACLQSASVCVRYPAANSSSVLALAPSDQQIPEVVLNAPSALGPCTNLSIDASLSSGSGGRKFRNVIWSVNSTEVSSLQSLQSYLSLHEDVSQTLLVSADILPPANYVFTLSVENFLGRTSSSSVAVLVTTKFLPIVHILGPNFITTRRYTALSIQAIGSVPQCIANQNLSYSWRVYKDYVYQPNLVSSSKDPRKLTLAAYSLISGATYQVEVIAQLPEDSAATGRAMATVYVDSGEIFALIQGGYSRTVSQDLPVTLDASGSIDNDAIPGSPQNLLFSWKCTISSLTRYGEDCALDLPSGPIVVIPKRSLNFNYQYYFTLVVMSEFDMSRQAGATLLVTVVQAPVAYAWITSPYLEFNSNEKLVLNATILGNSSVLAMWHLVETVSSLTWESTGVSLTPIAANISEAEVAPSIVFPLLVNALVFAPGRSYTFQLSVFYWETVTGSGTVSNAHSLMTSVQVTLLCNGPPNGGSLSVVPANGTAMETVFTLAGFLWADDPSDFPLSYGFSYTLDPTLQFTLNMGIESFKSSISGVLPGGLQQYEFSVTCMLKVSDVHGASIISNTTLIVLPRFSSNNPEVNSEYLAFKIERALAMSFASIDIESAIISINTMASTLNAIDCSAAPNCSSLHRGPCLSTSQMCGPCRPGYAGVPGDSNVVCLSPAGAIGVGDTCTETTHSNCIYSYCLDGKCSVPQKSCPSSVRNLPCSGHGVCAFVDIVTSHPESLCSVISTYCEAVCKCADGYGGSDCSLSPASMSARASARETICSGLLHILAYQDESPVLLQALAASLSQAFNPYEMNSDHSVCIDLLAAVSNLAAQGLLKTGSGVEANIAASISAFISGNITSNSTGFRVSTSTDAFIRGLQGDMVPGQEALSVFSPLLNVRTQYQRLSELYNKTLYAPLSPGDTAALSITLPPTGLDICGYTVGYALIALVQWRKDYLVSNFTSGGRLLGFSTTTPLEVSTADFLSNAGVGHSAHRALQGTYTLSLEFSTAQNWTGHTPGCAVTRGEVSSRCHCSVTSYDYFRVTFLCEDLLALCPRSSLTRRLAVSEGYSGFATDVEGSSEPNPLSTFAALGGGAMQVIVSTLGTAPNFANVSQDETALGFVVGITFAMVIGLLFFKQWDARDHNVLIYVKNPNLGVLKSRSDGGAEVVGAEPGLTEQDHKADMLRDDSDFIVVGEGRGRNGEYVQGSVAGSTESALIRHVDGLAIKKFLEGVLPAGRVYSSRNSLFKAFIISLVSHHVWVRMVSYSSLQLTRSMRFLILYNHILIIMFVNTVFYSTFFPNTCKSYDASSGGSNTTCLSQISSWSRKSVCKWHSGDGLCVINPPPSNLMFYATVAIIISVFIIVPSSILSFIMEEFCSKRPRLEEIGVDSRNWLGRPSDPCESGLNVIRRSELGRAIIPEVRDTQTEELDIVRPPNEDINYLFKGALTVDEEISEIVEEAREFLKVCQDAFGVTWWESLVPIELVARRASIMKELGMLGDGSFAPLTTWQRVCYGDPVGRLRWKIKRARNATNEILESMSSISEGEEDMRDRCLIQFFILEQMTPLKRFAVSVRKCEIVTGVLT